MKTLRSGSRAKPTRRLTRTSSPNKPLIYPTPARKRPEHSRDFSSILLLAFFLSLYQWLRRDENLSAPPPRPEIPQSVEDWSGMVEPPAEKAPPAKQPTIRPRAAAQKKPSAPAVVPPVEALTAIPSVEPADTAKADSLAGNPPPDAEARPVNPLLTDPSSSFFLKKGISEWSRVDTLTEREKRLRIAERFKEDWKEVEEQGDLSALKDQVRSRGLKDSHIPGIYLLDSNLIILPGILLYQF